MKKITLLLFLACTLISNAQDCVDSTLINPNAICPMIWAPVCGCNGVTYSNSCEAINFGGVTEYVDGECVPSGGCMDMSGLDFGMCDMWLGYAYTSSGCQPFSGCGYTIGNIDYSPNFYSDLESCIAACGAVEGNCISDTQLEWGQTVDCMDLNQPVCGCNGETYQNPCFAFYYGGVTTYALEPCDTNSADCQVIPMYITFGECAMPLGFVRQEGSMCVALSGCGYIGSNGYDYSEYFFTSEYECNSFCLGQVVIDCVDSTLIDENMGCLAVYDPVCGCDGVTYSNECEATYHHGITMFEAGECETQGILQPENGSIRVYPNPANDVVRIQFDTAFEGVLEVRDLSGRLITSIRTNGSTSSVDVSQLSAGTYVLRTVSTSQESVYSLFYKK